MKAKEKMGQPTYNESALAAITGKTIDRYVAVREVRLGTFRYVGT
jgi:hypothetical protein